MFLHDKKGLGKKTKKGDVVTRFWYTSKNLHPNRNEHNINLLVSFIFVTYFFCTKFFQILYSSHKTQWKHGDFHNETLKKLNLLSYVNVEKLPCLRFGFG